MYYTHSWGAKGNAFIRLVFHWLNASLYEDLFPMAPGHSTRPLVPMVQLVPMELSLFDWCSMREMHLIIKISNTFQGLRVNSSAFSLSIDANATFSTNGDALNRLVFHW